MTPYTLQWHLNKDTPNTILNRLFLLLKPQGYHLPYVPQRLNLSIRVADIFRGQIL